MENVGSAVFQGYSMRRYLLRHVWFPLKRKLSCDCYYAIVSSKSCRKCGKHATIPKERVDQMLIDYTWMNYAVGRAMYELGPNQGEKADPSLAHQWLRTTLPKDHPNYIDPKNLGYGVPTEPVCQTCGNKVRRWGSSHIFSYCETCCPHREWFPYAGTGDDVCKQCGGVF